MVNVTLFLFFQGGVREMYANSVHCVFFIDINIRLNTDVVSHGNPIQSSMCDNGDCFGTK